MTGVMNYGMGKFGDAMGTHYGKVLQSRMDELLEKADQCVDYYLPEEHQGSWTVIAVVAVRGSLMLFAFLQL